MLIGKLVDMDEVERQIAAGMVKRQERAGLAILNYTQMAQFTPALWNGTTDQCRGIVYEVASCEVIARPFPKFWNLNDERHPETMMANLPASLPSVTKKHDGSLGIGFKSMGEMHIATRGSFHSDQARWATEWIRKHEAWAWPTGWTPLFEIVYRDNRIVVNYGDWEGLILLAMVNIKTGEEAPRVELVEWAEVNGLKVVEEYDHALDTCLAEDLRNEEGYVLTWNLGPRPPLKVKVKFETYKRLHKLLTQTSPLGVWEMLRDGKNIDELLVDVPAEFAEWIGGIAAELRCRYAAVDEGARAAMCDYPGSRNMTDPANKKAFAFYAQEKGELAPLLFSLSTYDSIIWKSLRPNGNDRTFKVDEE